MTYYWRVMASKTVSNTVRVLACVRFSAFHAIIAIISTKRKECYSKVVCCMRCGLAFSLARSAIRCIRGSRSMRRRAQRLVLVDLVDAEAHLI